MCVYMYMCVGMYMRVYTYVGVCTYVRTYECTCVFIVYVSLFRACLQRSLDYIVSIQKSDGSWEG